MQRNFRNRVDTGGGIVFSIATAKESLESQSLCEKNTARLTSNTICSGKKTLHDKPHLKNKTESQSPIYAQPVKTRRNSTKKSATQETARKGSDVMVSNVTKGENVNKLDRRSSLNGEDDILPGDVYAEPYMSGRNSEIKEIEENFEVRTNSDTQSVLQDKRRKSETRSRGFVILKSPRETPTRQKRGKAIGNAESSFFYEEDQQPREKRTSTLKSKKPRTQSARQIHIDKFKQRRKFKSLGSPTTPNS